jgi:hypothetical protein
MGRQAAFFLSVSRVRRYDRQRKMYLGTADRGAKEEAEDVGLTRYLRPLVCQVGLAGTVQLSRQYHIKQWLSKGWLGIRHDDQAIILFEAGDLFFDCLNHFTVNGSPLKFGQPAQLGIHIAGESHGMVIKTLFRTHVLPLLTTLCNYVILSASGKDTTGGYKCQLFGFKTVLTANESGADRGDRSHRQTGQVQRDRQ